jgi:hypothetical protein
MHDRTAFLLKQVGLSLLELPAVEADPLHLVQDRPAGFGLIGGTGLGKTWVMARRLGLQVQGMVEDDPTPDTARMPSRFARWRNWPEMAETLKRWIAQSYTDDVADLVEDLVDCRQLYLDDLGQERIVGADDYALGILREVLDRRYRNQRPVFWTSNQPVPELTRLYGARTASRILSTWPPVVLKGPDLRLASARRPA